ncbi:DUF3558 family protein [Dietzia sp. DQ11-44]|uniref:DUF3558 family protein n=1 Tax=unclassified Dietzia TaxID=2617939 RepID=UPI00321FE704
MGTLRGPAAALAACAVMSACGVSQDNDQATTTSPAAAEETINPWDLPIEQRPALFDPCAEIPIEAVEQGVGGPVEANELLSRHEPGGLMVCGWKSRSVHVNVLSTWKPREAYVSDPGFVVKELNKETSGRKSLLLAEKGDSSDSTCLQLFFTPAGTVWIKLDLVSALNEFSGKRFTKACDALDVAVLPIIPHLPLGDI